MLSECHLVAYTCTIITFVVNSSLLCVTLIGEYNCFVETTSFWSYASSCLDESSCVSGKQYALILQLISRIARHHVPAKNKLTLLLLRKACSDKTLWNQTCVRIAWLRGMSILTGDANVSVYNSGMFCL